MTLSSLNSDLTAAPSNHQPSLSDHMFDAALADMPTLSKSTQETWHKKMGQVFGYDPTRPSLQRAESENFRRALTTKNWEALGLEVTTIPSKNMEAGRIAAFVGGDTATHTDDRIVLNQEVLEQAKQNAQAQKSFNTAVLEELFHAMERRLYPGQSGDMQFNQATGKAEFMQLGQGIAFDEGAIARELMKKDALPFAELRMQHQDATQGYVTLDGERIQAEYSITEHTDSLTDAGVFARNLYDDFKQSHISFSPFGPPTPAFRFTKDSLDKLFSRVTGLPPSEDNPNSDREKAIFQSMATHGSYQEWETIAQNGRDKEAGKSFKESIIGLDFARWNLRSDPGDGNGASADKNRDIGEYLSNLLVKKQAGHGVTGINMSNADQQWYLDNWLLPNQGLEEHLADSLLIPLQAVADLKAKGSIDKDSGPLIQLFDDIITDLENNTSKPASELLGKTADDPDEESKKSLGKSIKKAMQPYYSSKATPKPSSSEVPHQFAKELHEKVRFSNTELTPQDFQNFYQQAFDSSTNDERRIDPQQMELFKQMNLLDKYTAWEDLLQNQHGIKSLQAFRNSDLGIFFARWSLRTDLGDGKGANQATNTNIGNHLKLLLLGNEETNLNHMSHEDQKWYLNQWILPNMGSLESLKTSLSIPAEAVAKAKAANGGTLPKDVGPLIHYLDTYNATKTLPPVLQKAKVLEAVYSKELEQFGIEEPPEELRFNYSLEKFGNKSPELPPTDDIQGIQTYIKDILIDLGLTVKTDNAGKTYISGQGIDNVQLAISSDQNGAVAAYQMAQDGFKAIKITPKLFQNYRKELTNKSSLSEQDSSTYKSSVRANIASALIHELSHAKQAQQVSFEGDYMLATQELAAYWQQQKFLTDWLTSQSKDPQATHSIGYIDEQNLPLQRFFRIFDKKLESEFQHAAKLDISDKTSLLRLMQKT